jgi:ankyrin repeat protein
MPNVDGSTALHFLVRTNVTTAQKKEALSVLEAILTRRANLNAQNSTGLTPLHNACVRQRKFWIKLLVAHHANLNLQTKYLLPCFDFAYT